MVFLNNSYDVIISIYGITNKILSLEPNYIVDVAMWPMFGNYVIFMREFIITLILQEFDQENELFWWVFLVQVQ